MAQRRTKEEVLAEFHRRYNVFETILECQFPFWPADHVTLTKESVVTREGMLRWLEIGEATASDILAGTQQALNDMAEMLVHQMEDKPEQATMVLEEYKKRTGRDFWDDAGNPLRAAKTIIRRGQIKTDTEFYLLKGLTSDLDLKILSEKMRDKAWAMLHEYEFSTKQA